MTDTARPAISPRHSRTGLLLGLVAVFLFQLYHLYGLHISRDLPLWDESAYLGWGDEFLQDHLVGSITNSPFYHILYAGLITVFGLIPSIFAMQYMLKLLLTVVVYLLALRFSRSPALSVLLAFFLGYSYYHLGIDVLVYYAGLIPFVVAILLCRRAPLLSLGFSFLAGLARLEYMAVPIVHLLYVLVSQRRGAWMALTVLRSWPERGLTFLLWAFNGFVLTRITVWHFHNRVWFAWSQNYAYFRFITGHDTGINPWLDHESITGRDFPHAQSLGEAFAVNPRGVLEHAWFNLRELPQYLAGFLIAHDNAGHFRNLPVYIVAAVVLIGVLVALRFRPTRAEVGCGFRRWDLELVLCFGGIIAASPGVIVSSKTNYIMSLVPAAVAVIAAAHLAARRSGFYARWSSLVFLGLAGAFAIFTVTRPPAFSTKAPRGQVYRDVMTMRELLAPFRGLTLLGTSTASYVNYLGRANGYIFSEPLAISPINQQATDLTLAGLIRSRHPEVLLINSTWQSSKSYATAVAGFTFEGWEPHPLVDGTLYLKAGLRVVPMFDEGWFATERAGDREWHWSTGPATIHLPNSLGARPISLQFTMRTVVPRDVKISLAGKQVAAAHLVPTRATLIHVENAHLDHGENQLRFETAEPASRPPGEADTRSLAISVEDFELTLGPLPKTD